MNSPRNSYTITLTSSEDGESLTVPITMSESRPPLSWLRPSRQGMVDNVWAGLFVAIPAALVVLLGAWVWNRYLDGPQVWDTIIFVSQLAFTALVPFVLLVSFRSFRAIRDVGAKLDHSSDADDIRGIIKEELRAARSEEHTRDQLLIAELTNKLEKVIDEAAAAGKFRPRPRRDDGPGGGWFSALIRIWARHSTFPVPWEAFRDDIRTPRMAGLGGLPTLSTVMSLSGQPTVVTVNVTSMTQDRILRDVRLEVEGGRVRAAIMGVSADLNMAGPMFLFPSEDGRDPVDKAVIQLGNLDPGKPVVVHLLAEAPSFGPEPADFRWYLYEGSTELGSGLYERIRVDQPAA